MNSHLSQTVTKREGNGPGLRFGLGTLMLLMALASVCFALMATSPALGIGLAVLSIPASIRTSYISARGARPAGECRRTSVWGNSRWAWCFRC